MSDLSGWITVEAWCEKYNDHINTVHKRVNDGLWIRGEHYSAPDGGQSYVHEEKACAWLEQRGKLRL